jgi:hypothetical protein
MVATSTAFALLLIGALSHSTAYRVRYSGSKSSKAEAANSFVPPSRAHRQESKQALHALEQDESDPDTMPRAAAGRATRRDMLFAGVAATAAGAAAPLPAFALRMPEGAAPSPGMYDKKMDPLEAQARYGSGQVAIDARKAIRKAGGKVPKQTDAVR